MVFSSLEFLTFFLPAFLLVYALAPKAGRNGVLLIGSWIFYGWWSPRFLFLLGALTVLAWVGGLFLGALSPGRWRKWLLGILIAINAVVLFWFKYINILVESLGPALGFAGAMPLEWQRVTLPIGLSFVVLQVISYLIDVYRNEVAPQRRFIWFAAYLSMFGQLIAGPILRYAWVERELSVRQFTWDGFSAGARRFMVGLCMKVLIADTLSPLVEVAYEVSDPSFLDAWLACVAYTLQLFFDFAGYSAMAIGLGQMLGFHFPENFNNPYLARNIQDFWRRWHISLSTWIRDYLYIPFGGSRKGPIRTYFNLMLTMAIAGLWHGSDSPNFLIWGVLHGAALVLSRWWGRSGLPSLSIVLTRTLTLIFVCMAWVTFRAPDLGTAGSIYLGQLGMQGWPLGEALRTTLRASHGFALAFGMFCIVAPLMRDGFRRRMPQGVLAWLDLWPVFGFVIAVALIAGRDAVPFLYFQF